MFDNDSDVLFNKPHEGGVKTIGSRYSSTKYTTKKNTKKIPRRLPVSYVDIMKEQRLNNLKERLKKIQIEGDRIIQEIQVKEKQIIREPLLFGPKLINCNMCNTSGSTCSKCRCMLHNTIHQPKHSLCWLISIIHILMLSDKFTTFTFLQNNLQSLDFKIDENVAQHLNATFQKQIPFAVNTEYNFLINGTTQATIKENPNYFRDMNKINRIKYTPTSINLFEEMIFDNDILRKDPNGNLLCPLQKAQDGSYQGYISYKVIVPFLVQRGFRYIDIKHININYEKNVEIMRRHYPISNIQYGKDIHYMRVLSEYVSYLSTGIRPLTFDDGMQNHTIGVIEQPKVLIVSIFPSEEAFNTNEFRPLYLGKYIVILKHVLETNEYYLLVYELDSMLLSSFAYSTDGIQPKITSMHVISCVTCNNEEYIVNSHGPSLTFNEVVEKVKNNKNTASVYKFPWKKWNSNKVYGNIYPRGIGGCGKNSKIYHRKNFKTTLATSEMVNGDILNGIPANGIFYHRDMSANVFVYVQNNTETYNTSIEITKNIAIPAANVDTLLNVDTDNNNGVYSEHIMPYFIYFLYNFELLLQKYSLGYSWTDITFTKYKSTDINDIMYNAFIDLYTKEYFSILSSGHQEYRNDVVKYIHTQDSMEDSDDENWSTYFINVPTNKNGLLHNDYLILKTILDKLIIDIMPEDFIISSVSNYNHILPSSEDYILIYAIRVQTTNKSYIKS